MQAETSCQAKVPPFREIVLQVLETLAEHEQSALHPPTAGRACPHWLCGHSSESCFSGSANLQFRKIHPVASWRAD